MLCIEALCRFGGEHSLEIVQDAVRISMVEFFSKHSGIPSLGVGLGASVSVISWGVVQGLNRRKKRWLLASFKVKNSRSVASS